MVEPVVIGGATLYQGDCRDVLQSLTGAEAIVSDPPYGMAWNTDSRRFSGGKSESLGRKPRGPGRAHAKVEGDDKPFDPEPWLSFRGGVVLWGANHFASRLPVGKTLVWVKKPEHLWGSWLSDAEVGWASGGHGVYCKFVSFPPPVRASDAGGDPGFPVAIHPTQKPTALMDWCIGMTTGETVVDPYMGSGTTGVAAIRIGRKFIGCEVNPEYFDIACKRIEAAVREPRLQIVQPPPPPRQVSMFDEGAAA